MGCGYGGNCSRGAGRPYPPVKRDEEAVPVVVQVVPSLEEQIADTQRKSQAFIDRGYPVPLSFVRELGQLKLLKKAGERTNEG